MLSTSISTFILFEHRFIFHLFQQNPMKQTPHSQPTPTASGTDRLGPGKVISIHFKILTRFASQQMMCWWNFHKYPSKFEVVQMITTKEIEKGWDGGGWTFHECSGVCCFNKPPLRMESVHRKLLRSSLWVESMMVPFPSLVGICYRWPGGYSPHLVSFYRNHTLSVEITQNDVYKVSIPWLHQNWVNSFLQFFQSQLYFVFFSRIVISWIKGGFERCF